MAGEGVKSEMSNSRAGAGEGGTVAARSSVWESIRGCGISGMRIDKEELRRRILMPAYLRSAMASAIRAQDANAGAEAAMKDGAKGRGGGPEVDEMPEAPMVVFVNSRSGGRHGPQLKLRLQELISEEQVFDLSVTQPPQFVRYGLTCLENLANLGDDCAKAVRENLRVMVAGGDGTVGWVLGSLGELFVQKREPVPPTGIIPLGTGNDLSRSFGWGGSFPFAWRSAVKRSLLKAVSNPVQHLDSWHVTIMMQETGLDLPYSLKPLQDYDLTQDVDIQRELPESVSCFGGVFYNYLSIGMDAQVAYGFHHLRNKKPYLAQGPISNKLIYAGYGCTQGWFFTPCVKTPGLSVRAIVLLNLDSYGGGRHPWGRPMPEYLEKAAAVKLELRGGQWNKAYMQMDGEPWKQSIEREYSTFVKIERVAFQSRMISGK
ncbi:Diacylglycerol kinase [Musa troglodytarum]|uniref:Diacylglycerol kinase n=1 Tax=Musa troglodytarum TaxID=320322 RepID=A0A9E7L4R9_9LILI|nr:Diacylglycerol kinase [Musa troglodytarum]